MAQKTRPGRIAVYLARMFPPWVTIPLGVVHFLAVELTLQALSGRSPLAVSWRSVAGTASIVLFSLVLRVQDELKDAATDIRLAAAGDPRYVGRPIVTGEITVADLAVLRYVCFALLLGINLPLGYPAPLVPFLVTGGLIWASGRWFFWPRISKDLLLAFVTHNPLSVAISGYAAAVALRGLGPGGLTVWTAPLLVGLWTPVAAWEVARKIRVPADETDYETYSKRLGARKAALLAAFFVLVSATTLGGVARAAGLGWTLPLVLGAVALLPIGGCLVFAIAPSTARSNLRPLTEVYAGLAGTALVVALVHAYGIAT